NVSEARANVQKTYANFKRAKELIKKNFISKTEYDRLNAESRVSSAERDKAVKALSDTELKAPFSGYISELYVENFQAVQAKQQVARLVDLSQIEMIIDIPESKISLVPYAEEIKVIFDAFPDNEITAAVKEIGTEASPTTRTYPVTLIMEQPKGIKILPGMSGKARGRASKDAPNKMAQNKGIQVPVSAVYSPANDEKSYVWVINESSGLVRRQAVTLGKIVSTGLIITEGLKVGEWVATAGVHFIREGMKVRIMQDKEK
ncbi:MAG: efflux RND transporter periplasmic adaptor subunit, partial [Methylococcaceae bacterium]|nr:efflux RND transporter periplasmic adaptor subunit [Methylococcaceae bacterium]